MSLDPLPDLPASSRPMQEAMADRISGLLAGGGALTPNWATFQIGSGAELKPDVTPGDGGSNHVFTEEEFFFQDWYGQNLDVPEPNDFTFDTVLREFGPIGGEAVVRSTRGGVFQATAIVASPTQAQGEPDNPALVVDPAFTHQRYLWFGLVVGEYGEAGIGSVGLDGQVPLLVQLQNGRSGTTFTSSIGYTPPGGVVLRGFGASLIGGAGDDNVPIQGLVPIVAVYQVG